MREELDNTLALVWSMQLKKLQSKSPIQWYEDEGHLVLNRGLFLSHL